MRHASDESVHEGRPAEWVAKCPYCHPERINARVNTQAEAEQLRRFYGLPEPPPVMPQRETFRSNEAAMLVEARMAQQERQYRVMMYQALMGKK